MTKKEKLLEFINAANGVELDKATIMDALRMTDRNTRKYLRELSAKGLCKVALRWRNARLKMIVNPGGDEGMPCKTLKERRTRQAIPDETVPDVDRLVEAGFSYARIAKVFSEASDRCIKPHTISAVARRRGTYARFPKE